MWIKALIRFNYHEPGEVFKAGDEDAKLWIDEGYAEEAQKPEKENRDDSAAIDKEEDETKGPEGPAKDKAIKKANKKK